MVFRKKDEENREGKYQEFYQMDEVNRWYLNMRARSPISADIRRRSLALYCELNGITPTDILKQAEDNTLKKHFQDFVSRMMDQGHKGAYVVKFKYVLMSWLKFNDTDYRIGINVPNENINETTENERVPTPEEVAKMIRKTTSRGRVSISLMAFSGLRPEVLGNYEGDDGLTLGDIEDLDIDALEFKAVPAKINVRVNLSKARFKYFSFLGDEGCRYLIDYLQERKKAGEDLTPESPLLVPDSSNRSTKWKYLRTMLVTREIRTAIRSAGLNMRPYILRAYFATALDIAESKGLISHPWRQFFMGHRGDIEAVYSTNKRPLPGKVEEMRMAYTRASQFFETVPKARGDSERVFKEAYIESVLTTLEALGQHVEVNDKERDRLLGLDFETLKEEMKSILGSKPDSRDASQAAAMDRRNLLNSRNGPKQKVIPMEAIEAYVNEGFDFITAIPGNRAIVRLP